MAIKISYNTQNTIVAGSPAMAFAPESSSIRVPDHSKLDAALLPHAQHLITEWCGEIKVSGDEIGLRNPLREDKNIGSFSFNTRSGKWNDFAVPGCSGHGLTTLHAMVTGISLPESVSTLAALTPSSVSSTNTGVDTPKPVKPKVEAVNPADVRLPPDLHPDHGFPTMTWEYRDADNKLSFMVFRFEHDGKKETRPLSWSPEKGAWVWQYPTNAFPVYNLSGLLARPTATVVITEGEKASDAAAIQFPEAVVITSACGSEQALKSDWSPLKGRNVIIAPDKDEPGKHYALSVAGAAFTYGARTVKVIDVWQLPDWETGDDLADHIVGQDFLDTAKTLTEVFQLNQLEPHIIKAASALSRGDLDRIKKVLAENLGIGVRTLEGLVKEGHTKTKKDTEVSAEPGPFSGETLEPWDVAIKGDDLFSELQKLIHKHVVLTPAQCAAVVAWIVFSYGFEAMRICPQLLINSPSKRCGKSTLMEVIMGLVQRPLPAANISSAAVFRSIESWKPTLLIDEADTFLKGNDDITGIINSGHNRSLAFVIRTKEVDGDHQPVSFSTFCPKVIAMINAPADTIIDRSIVITLVRKLSNQRVAALPIDFTDQMRDVRRRILRWTVDNLDSIQFDIESAPAMGNDRARQNWAVLASFTQLMGPKSHAALLGSSDSLCDTSDIEENLEVELLNDIREELVWVTTTHIQSKVLTSELCKLSERPWGEINRGKPLTENKLAGMLKPFKVKPEKFRDGVKTHRGYCVDALNDVFDRYLIVMTDRTATAGSTSKQAIDVQAEQVEQPEQKRAAPSIQCSPIQATGTCSGLPNLKFFPPNSEFLQWNLCI